MTSPGGTPGPDAAGGTVPAERYADARVLEAVRAFLERLGLAAVSFDRVVQSLTHRSYAFEHPGAPDNERLEFLGDAVLGWLAADFLYETFPEEREGALSKRRAFIVSRPELGRRACEMGLDAVVLLGCGEEASGGRQRLALVGSALEAFVGVIQAELPPPELSRLVRRHILQPGLDALDGMAHTDFKSHLQETAQKLGLGAPVYRRIAEAGPGHARSFTVEVDVGGICLGAGEGRRVKSAENRAARAACERLETAGAAPPAPAAE